MPEVRGVEFLLECLAIGQVAVVPHDNAIGGIDIEGLRLGITRASGGRVAHMRNAERPDKALKICGPENIAHQARALAKHQPPVVVTGGNTRCVLPAMLKQGQTVVQATAHRVATNYAENAAHVRDGTPVGGSGIRSQAGNDNQVETGEKKKCCATSCGSCL